MKLVLDQKFLVHIHFSQLARNRPEEEEVARRLELVVYYRTRFIKSANLIGSKSPHSQLTRPNRVLLQPPGMWGRKSNAINAKGGLLPLASLIQLCLFLKGKSDTWIWFVRWVILSKWTHSHVIQAIPSFIIIIINNNTTTTTIIIIITVQCLFFSIYLSVRVAQLQSAWFLLSFWEVRYYPLSVTPAEESILFLWWNPESALPICDDFLKLCDYICMCSVHMMSQLGRVWSVRLL